MYNIDFPFHFASSGRTASADQDDHINNMIEQLLFTSPGERVNRAEFGSGLLQMVFEPNSPELAATLQFAMQSALQQWLGDVVQVLALDVKSVEANLNVTVHYLIRRTNEQRTVSFEGIRV
jgi:uncharacterized protein